MPATTSRTNFLPKETVLSHHYEKHDFKYNFQEGKNTNRQLKLSAFFVHFPKISGHFAIYLCFCEKQNLVFLTEKANRISHKPAGKHFSELFFFGEMRRGGSGGAGGEQWSKAEA